MGNSMVMWVPQARWLVYFMENPTKMDDLGYSTPIFRKPPYVIQRICLTYLI